MHQCRVLTCQGITLVSLDGYHAHGARHLQRSMVSVDDCHKLQEERPPKDTVVSNVKAGHLERQHLLALIVPYSTRHLQVDALDGSGRLLWDDPVKRIMHGVKSFRLRLISMKVFFMIRFNEAPLSINFLATLCHPIGILTTNDKFLSDSSVFG
jgi:hypothetical protein